MVNTKVPFAISKTYNYPDNIHDNVFAIGKLKLDKQAISIVILYLRQINAFSRKSRYGVCNQSQSDKQKVRAVARQKTGPGVWPGGRKVFFVLNFWSFCFKTKGLAPAAMSGTEHPPKRNLFAEERSIKSL